MNLLKELQEEKNNLFQFYIVVGDSKKNREIVLNFLKEEFDFDFHKNFLLMEGKEDEKYIFKIEDARKLKKENSVSVAEGEKKIIFLDYKKINLDTQNALLKTFEETVKNSHIFLFVPSEEFLLPTVKSRGRIIFGEKNLDRKLAKKFFEGSFLEREKIISKFDRGEIASFLNALEELILEDKNLDRDFYRKFLELKKYIFDKGVGLKNILTWIAMNL